MNYSPILKFLGLRLQRERRKPLDFCLCAVRTLLRFFYTATALELMPGVVAVIQNFGERINFHPHIHCLVTEGGTAPDGSFHRVCRFHDTLIQEIFTHVDPLVCPSCGGQMRIISFIEEPKTIDRIIAHLELTFEAERPPPPHNVRHELLMAAEEREEYF